jgi:hypothetical protein
MNSCWKELSVFFQFAKEQKLINIFVTNHSTAPKKTKNLTGTLCFVIISFHN